MGRALEEAKAAMRIAQDHQSHYANKGRRDVEHQPAAGEYVLLDSKNMRLKGENASESLHRFIGPFKILEKVHCLRA